MDKTSVKNKIMVVISSCILMLVFLLPFFSNIDIVAYAEEPQEKIKESLVSANYIEGLTDAKIYEKYNILVSQISNFTPFDYEKEERMDGSSFEFVTDEKNQINEQYVLLQDIGDLDESANYALDMWIYFDSLTIHNLKISLKLENNATLDWSFTSESLANLLSKYSYQMGLLPYAWNKISFPFELATVTGKVFDDGVMVAPEKLIIDYSSVLAEEEKYAKLKFYDVNITTVEDNTDYTIEKQDYIISSFNFFSQDVINTICVGDTIKVPTFANAVNYAWYGSLDVSDSRLIVGDSGTIAWKVVLEKPDLSVQVLSFGDEITFTEAGVYEIYYQCVNSAEKENLPIVSAKVLINVEKLNAVYFNKKDVSFSVGKTYVLNVKTSSMFTSISNFTFTTSSNNVSVVDLGNGLIEVTVKKEGTYKLTASVLGSRPASPENQEYSTVLKITAKNSKENMNKIMKIALLSVLGVFVLILAICGIKTIIKANKYVVK